MFAVSGCGFGEKKDIIKKEQMREADLTSKEIGWISLSLIAPSN